MNLPPPLIGVKAFATKNVPLLAAKAPKTGYGLRLRSCSRHPKISSVKVFARGAAAAPRLTAVKRVSQSKQIKEWGLAKLHFE